MTCNTSAVAVCCSKASRVSVNSRAFSNRDDRLRREILQQSDLLLGEWAGFPTIKLNRAQEGAVLAQRHEQPRLGTGNIDEGLTQGGGAGAVGIGVRHIDGVRHRFAANKLLEDATRRRHRRLEQNLA